MQANNRKGVLQADIDFHALIYGASGNPLIAETMQLHWQHLRRTMGEVARTPGLSIRVWREHGAILEEMVQGDPDAASMLMRDHIVNAYEWICSGDACLCHLTVMLCKRRSSASARRPSRGCARAY